MADVINLLSDAIANQIAAGEVVQRPASVVKELLENSVDAGSTDIRLYIKDGGHSLIQVVDNGCGMTETDARMCFERHATSKIRTADDLFHIRTMGFRGEALASIAAVAQVELKTRRNPDDTGTLIAIEGSKIQTQEICSTPPGTSFSVKNLFYNVPARRNFLKSPPVEMRHILDEFQRVALANPDIFFSLHHNQTEIYHLPAGNLRQRIVNIFGKNYNDKIIPIEEETDLVKISGFVGKPEFSKKTRGEQLFFVNNRFVKSGYLHHAVMMAFEDLLPKENFPFYAIYMDIDASKIDVNVHPTKQEIKFEDEKLIYQFIKVAVRHALGQFTITPMLDFDPSSNIDNSLKSNASRYADDISNERYQSETITYKSGSSNYKSSNENLKNWQSLYENLTPNQDFFSVESPNFEDDKSITLQSNIEEDNENISTGKNGFNKHHKEPYQIHNCYIVSPIKSGYMLIDQQFAHERILYERFLSILGSNAMGTQKQLFPKKISLNAADAEVLRYIIDEIMELGIEIQEAENNHFIIHGLPAEQKDGIDEQALIEGLVEQYRFNLDMDLSLKDSFAKSMAKSASIKRGKTLSIKEMNALIDQLFACEIPYKSPGGHHCFITYDLEDLKKQFLNN
ncbi:MAG: DNA mismatch repair endonuclease MutL [Saprospiraceae bacterium]|nr:DNA mismatch repair endonuclease MutL [Saprospiraceae bacterium]